MSYNEQGRKLLFQQIKKGPSYAFVKRPFSESDPAGTELELLFGRFEAIESIEGRNEFKRF